MYTFLNIALSLDQDHVNRFICDYDKRMLHKGLKTEYNDIFQCCNISSVNQFIYYNLRKTYCINIDDFLFKKIRDPYIYDES